MKNIGILGGLSPESTIVYYEKLTKLFYNHFKDFTSPEIIIHSFNFQDTINQNYLIPDKIRNAITFLHFAGADFVIAACNSIHKVHDNIVQKIPIPWISIVDTVAKEIKCKKLHKVGVLGTSFVMKEKFYRHKLWQWELESVVPSFEEQDVINQIIYNELCRGIVKDSSRQIILKCINSLVVNSGIEGIVLGCTELPSIINQDLLDIPVFDTTQLHIKRAFEFSLEE